MQKLAQNALNDLDVKAKTIKLFKENIDVNLCELEWGNGFLDMTSKVHTSKRNR